MAGKINGGDLVDLIRVEGVNAKGYGTIPKAVMLDRRLTICAKAIYAYFCSYCGAGSQAFPSFGKIIKDLQISKTYYYDNLKLLKKYDYVKVKQQRIGGQFKRNIYTLSPFPTSQETVGAPFPTTRDTVTQEHNINRDNINRYDVPSYQSKSAKGRRRRAGQVTGDMIDRIDHYSKLIKDNIEYDTLIGNGNDKFVNSIVATILDTLISDAPTFRINGADMDAAAVKQRLLQLDYFDIGCVLNSVDSIADHVRNPKSYLLTVLYNAPATSEMYWKSEITCTTRDFTKSGRQHKDYSKEIQTLEELEDL